MKLRDIAAFLIGRLPNLKAVKEEEFCRGILWYAERDLFRIVVDGGILVGAVFFRRLPDGVNGDAAPYTHVDDAPVLWVDWVVCIKPEAYRRLIAEIPRRFSRPPVRIEGTRIRRHRRKFSVPTGTVHRFTPAF